MEREAMNQLLAWKDDPDRKPLILKGARQVGKTWLMKEFGKMYRNPSIRFLRLPCKIISSFSFLTWGS